MVPFHPPVGGPEQEFPDAEQMAHLEAIAIEGEAASHRAELLAPDLVGMRVVEAQDVVSQYPGVTLEVRDPGRARTAMAFAGRIYAHAENGRIVRACLW